MGVGDADRAPKDDRVDARCERPFTTVGRLRSAIERRGPRIPDVRYVQARRFRDGLYDLINRVAGLFGIPWSQFQALPAVASTVAFLRALAAALGGLA